MVIHHLAHTNSILNTFLMEIRDVSIQGDAMRFRRNIERIGEILAYEMSKTFEFESVTIETPLGRKATSTLKNNVVVCSILRAGLPLQYGLMNFFDKADCAFISAYRKHTSDGTSFTIEVEYVACPDLSNKTLVLVDPMLATGQSLVLTHKALQPFGAPKAIHLVSVIGAKSGIDYVKSHFSNGTQLWIADIDEQLDKNGYIIPGLGDAGDLAFGQKLQK